MAENIKVRWLTDHEQTKVAPKTLSSQVFNEDGTLYKNVVNDALEMKADKAEYKTAMKRKNRIIRILVIALGVFVVLALALLIIY